MPLPIGPTCMRLRGWLNLGLVVVFLVMVSFAGVLEAQTPTVAGRIADCTDAENLPKRLA